MENNRKRIIGIIAGILLCAAVFSILAYFMVQLNSCSGYFDNEALSAAQEFTVENSAAVQKSAVQSFEIAKKIAADASAVTGFENIDAFGAKAVAENSIACLQFYKDGSADYRYGNAVGSATSEQVKALVSGGVFGSSQMYVDESLGTGIKCIAVYCPVANNQDFDALVAYYQITDDFAVDLKHKDELSLFCVADSDGNMLDSYIDEGFPQNPSHNIFTYIDSVCENKPQSDLISTSAKQGLSGSYNLSVAGVRYAVCCVHFDRYGVDCTVISIYPVSKIIENQYSLYNRLFGATVGLLIVCVGALIAFIVIKHKSDSQLVTKDEFDPLYGCNTYNKFMREAPDIISINRSSKYAIIFFDINKFTYVKEHFDAETGESAIRYVCNVIDKMTTKSESYGHVLDDSFVALLHFSTMQELSDRIKVLDALVSNFEMTKSRGFSLKMSIGIYLLEREKNYTVQEMIDRATIAQKIHKKTPDKPFIIYDSNIRTSYLKEAEIESKMDYALKNHEFRIFFQPKYNISKDSMDGSEALVRWYDPAANAYIGPDLFVPLFEVNGFISKLDRYVFIEVCKYMKEALARGENVYPVSVNVSRVTATQADFLSYYVEKKREYKIADGLLMIEFTESFAYENYDTMENIVSTLKKNGFKCSIDDFGSGYSSFNILKELPMDELKLDKFFLKSGTDASKDETLIKMVVELGKNFSMKVTQEGVETIEQLNKMKELGCDVIQGYYYSKPIPMSDYIDFVAKDTSLESVLYKHGEMPAGYIPKKVEAEV